MPAGRRLHRGCPGRGGRAWTCCTCPRRRPRELLGHYGIRVLESAGFDDRRRGRGRRRRGWAGRWPSRPATSTCATAWIWAGSAEHHRRGFAALATSSTCARSWPPTAATDLEVQSMAPAGQGCVIRAVEDPLLGPVVSFGLAGDAVNLLDDWAHGIPPLTNTDLSDLVGTPRAAATPARLPGPAGGGPGRAGGPVEPRGDAEGQPPGGVPAGDQPGHGHRRAAPRCSPSRSGWATRSSAPIRPAAP